MITTGFEPVTVCLEGRCSIQLSYVTLPWLKPLKQNSKRILFVGVAGFEPAASSSQTRRDNRATLHPDGVTNKEYINLFLLRFISIKKNLRKEGDYRSLNSLIDTNSFLIFIFSNFKKVNFLHFVQINLNKKELAERGGFEPPIPLRV